MTDRTKLYIAEKMKELMRHQPIRQIRITQICKAAEIDRSTFYYHFADKYDLVAWIFYHTAENTDVIDPEQAAENIAAMKNEMIFFRRAFEDRSQDGLWEYMNQYFIKEYTEAAKRKLGTDVLDTQLLFSIRLYCYGSVRLAKEWILEDNVTSAKTVVSMMFASMPACMRSAYWGKEA